jgi:hypothetical protein
MGCSFLPSLGRGYLRRHLAAVEPQMAKPLFFAVAIPAPGGHGDCCVCCEMRRFDVQTAPIRPSRADATMPCRIGKPADPQADLVTMAYQGCL